MWRYVAMGLGVVGVGSCEFPYDCRDRYVYHCVDRYYDYYGIYTYCYAIRQQCGRDAGACTGADCEEESSPACKLADDCEPGQVCNADGLCAEETGPETPDAGADAPGGRSDVDGGEPDATGSDGATAHDASVSAGGAGNGNGGATAGNGGATAGNGAATAGNGGATAGNGGATSSGGTFSNGGTPDPGIGGASAGTGTGGTTHSGGASGSAGEPSHGGETSAGGAGGAGGGERVRRFNFPCQRSTQCGPGECIDGLCFNACTDDEDCGTGDRCSTDSGQRLCMPDPTPPLQCQATGDCGGAETCVNGVCHAACDVDTDCQNGQDRCFANLCFPDRRPMVECVFSPECEADEICLDGRCVSNLTYP